MLNDTTFNNHYFFLILACFQTETEKEKQLILAELEVTKDCLQKRLAWNFSISQFNCLVYHTVLNIKIGRCNMLNDKRKHEAFCHYITCSNFVQHSFC